jgi:hypothetical protein
MRTTDSGVYAGRVWVVTVWKNYWICHLRLDNDPWWLVGGSVRNFLGLN